MKHASDAAWGIVSQCTHVVVGKGKKVHHFELASADKAVVLKHVLGPTGNLRAPAIRVGKQLVVGFNADAYAEVFGG